jgi:uncharacterized protein (TIGR04255 family)
VKYSVKVTTFDEAGPFSDAHIDDVRLTKAPLARVLAQLRFPGPISSLRYGSDADIASLAGPLSGIGYPFLEEGHQLVLQVTPDGVTPHEAGKLWTFRSGDKSWHVTLTPEFVTLDTSAYTDRDEFLTRLSSLVGVLAAAVELQGVSRVGYRYINQVKGLSTAELRSIMRNELLGALAVPEGDARLIDGISEATFSLDPVDMPGGVADGLQARWGKLPPGVVLDASMPPTPEATWLLDIDSFRQVNLAFDEGPIIGQVKDLSVRAYRFFRWVTTPAFLTRFGATS